VFGDIDLKVEFEKVYKTYICNDTKKKYAGLTIFDGGVEYDPPVRDIVGFESVKKNTSQLLSDVQEQTITFLLNKQTQEAVKYIKEVKQKIKNNEYDNYYISQPQGMSKSIASYKNRPFNVTASLNSKSILKFNILPGQRMYVLKCRSSGKYPFPKSGWIAFTDDYPLPSDFKPNIDYYIDAIDSKIKSLFETVGMSIDGTTQEKLEWW
jgi:DNA polymerase elongation subunit (family B)